MFLTNILRAPKKKIFTFGDTDFDYLIVSKQENQSIVRKGNLNCGKPILITPESLLNTLQGFSEDAVRFAESEFAKIISKLRGLGYQFKNELKNREVYNRPVEEMLDSLMKDSSIEHNNSAIITAPDDIWALSLLKVSFEIVNNSFSGNIQDLEDRDMFRSDAEKKREEIETLFAEAKENKAYIKELGKKLQDYELFSEYEDRFFSLLN